MVTVSERHAAKREDSSGVASASSPETAPGGTASTATSKSSAPSGLCTTTPRGVRRIACTGVLARTAPRSWASTAST